MELKKAYNSIIPFEGCLAITIWPWVFIRKELMDKYKDVDHNHELIHACQQVELYVIGMILAAFMLIWGCGWWSLIPLGLFFEWYVIDWFIKVILCFFANKDGYYSICFEQEAFEHESDFEYLDRRKHFNWIKYIFKLKKRKRIYEV